MTYPEWHKEVVDLLSSERPDVKAEDLDPNGSYSAYKGGASPQQFVQAELPLKGAAPTSQPGPTSPTPPVLHPTNTPPLVGQKPIPPQPASRAWIGILLGVIFVVVIAAGAVGYSMYKTQQAETAASDKKTCQTNLQTIANAVQAYKVRSRSATYPTIADVSTEVGPNKLLSDLDSAPRCPSNPTNKYSVAPTSDGGFEVTCTDPSHGKWVDGTIVEAN